MTRNCRHTYVVVKVTTSLIFKVTHYRCSKCGATRQTKEA